MCLMELGIKEERKLQEENEVASQSTIPRTEAKEVSLFKNCLMILLNE